MDLLSVLDDVVTYCESKGAEAEVMGIERDEVIVTVERNDIKLCIKQYTTGIGVRTVINNAVGFACCNSLQKNIVEETAQKAIEMSKKTPSLPFNVLASPGDLPDVQGLYDPAIKDFTEEDAVDAAEILVTEATKDSRVCVDTGEFNVAVRTTGIKTSTGICAQEKKSLFSWFAVGLARDNQEVGSFEYQYGCTPHADSLYIEETARNLKERTVSNLYPKKVHPFTGDIILGPEAVSGLIGDPLIFALNANNVHRGQSVLADSLNTQIASPVLTVIDNPLVQGNFNSSAFDREGSPHQSVTMIRKGELTSFMYDALAARREDRAPTGNATGTFREIPQIGITSFRITGSHHINTMIKETESGLLVTRFSGAADYISGDFSGAVKGAHLITSGEIQHPVKGATIAGNVFELLPRITCVSEETMRYSKMILPYIKIPQMQIIA
jgi:PmbA protein